MRSDSDLRQECSEPFKSSHMLPDVLDWQRVSIADNITTQITTKAVRTKYRRVRRARTFITLLTRGSPLGLGRQTSCNASPMNSSTLREKDPWVGRRGGSQGWEHEDGERPMAAETASRGAARIKEEVGQIYSIGLPTA
ncbi:hypothetical protein LZ554_000788 [Drepanopeziza brunnea f. sp. 'monogermtubi']|nr:hypothetical protein LZ554_000788 [Drepanopeziza brunnea f. sp. 'monogermtubi']